MAEKSSRVLDTSILPSLKNPLFPRALVIVFTVIPREEIYLISSDFISAEFMY